MPPPRPAPLYHFTSPDRVGRIKREGLTEGLVIVPPPWAPLTYRPGDPVPPLPGQPPGTAAVAAYPGQWLTDDPDFRQEWATRSTIPHDRTAWRVRVEVPPRGTELLVAWPDFVGRKRLDQRWPLWLADFEGRTLPEGEGGAYGGRPDPSRWWVYLGLVPPQWLRQWTRRPERIGAGARRRVEAAR